MHHELEQLALVGIHRHRCARVHFGRQPGPLRDADECALSARHDVHAQPRSRQVDWNSFSLPQRLALFTHLRRRFRIAGESDLVAGRIIWNRAGDLRPGSGAACAARVASAHRQRAVRPDH